jgi:signal transduction histidine kinase
MSAATTPGAGNSGLGTAATRRDPESIRIYLRVTSSLMILALAAGTVALWPSLRPHLFAIAVWAVVVAIADLLPVYVWGDVSFSTSLPVTLAAGMVLGPMPAALVCAIGSTDPREFRKELSFVRSAYNRGQVAACVYAASTVFHAFGVPITQWPQILPPSLAAISIDFVGNMLFVAIPVGIRMGVSPTAVWRRIFGESPVEYVSGYVSLGLLSLLQATMVQVAGLWGLIASLAPLGLARQVFIQAQRLGAATSKIESKDRALVDATKQASEERRDERMTLAGELHDEVLPPLFKVHLMGQVLRQDLSSGRLLDLDEDLPELLSATEAAQGAIRGLVGGLRRSPIGTGGLGSTLRSLAQQLESAGSPLITLDLEEVDSSYSSQLLVYQVTREALNNAARHSRASRILVKLSQDDAMIRVLVDDDGIGFSPHEVDISAHFGLQLISERVEAASGWLTIDSRLGQGTVVSAALPVDVADPGTAPKG